MPYGKRKTYKNRDTQGRFSKRTKYLAGQTLGASNEYVAAGLGAAATISAGYDLVKGPSGTFHKSGRAKPSQIAHGWYVDTATGLQHKIKDYQKQIITQNGRKADFWQQSFIGDCIFNRINQVIIFDDWNLTHANAVTGVNERTLVTTTRQKTMFTNMSNVKICYEYYLVTPRVDAANSFQAEFNLLSNIVDSSSGGFDVITSWTPEQVPEVMKNWKILAKSVFRLAPGETGELHSKSKIYKLLSEADKRDRTYAAGFNVQLYCRWYGCPTAQQKTSDGTIVNPNASFGDNLLHTSWIIEGVRNYYKTAYLDGAVSSWLTTVPGAIAGHEVVTHDQTDDDIVAAE